MKTTGSICFCRRKGKGIIMMVEYYTGKRDKKGRLVKVWKAAERKGGAQTFSI